jgi:hypothetical protein
LPQFGHVAMAGVYGRSGMGTVLLVTVPASGMIGRKPGTRNGPGWLPCGRETEPRSGCGGAGAQAQCAGLRAGAAAPGAGRRASAGPGAARRGVAGPARAGRGQAGAHPVPVRATPPRSRPRPADRGPAVTQAGGVRTGPAGGAAVEPGRAGPVRGRPQRVRGGRRTLGRPPRPAQRRTGPPPAGPEPGPPSGWGCGWAAGCNPGCPAGLGAASGAPAARGR